MWMTWLALSLQTLAVRIAGRDTTIYTLIYLESDSTGGSDRVADLLKTQQVDA